MFGHVRQQIDGELDEIRSAGLFKAERVIVSPQAASIRVTGGAQVLNFCANNYLGLADDPRILAAAKQAMDQWGYGLASARFIGGTQDVHKRLEQRLSQFLGTEDTVLYSSCFDANAGLFETLLGEQDVVISDELNHASIIDGIRLSKARRRLIATDGVFSMDGYVTPLREICDLADRYQAMVMVDDSHAVGFVGASGRGTPELHGVTDRVDILTGTLGKALGGASGGYTSGRREIIDLLRQRSRPYLFSNSVAPAVAGASLAVLDLLETGDDLRARLRGNTAWFRERMTGLGFDILPGDKYRSCDGRKLRNTNYAGARGGLVPCSRRSRMAEERKRLPRTQQTGDARPRKPSSWDIAREAEVSQATVSRVINNSTRISKATSLRVRNAMERLGYTSNNAARTLITGRSNLN